MSLDSFERLERADGGATDRIAVVGVALTSGRAAAPVLVLDEPLSFWGGVDAVSGAIIDTHHPQVGQPVAGRILMLHSGRGSSSSSSVLAETIRNRVGPAAILLVSSDPILALGCLVAEELYGVQVPVVVLDEAAWRTCAAASTLTVEAADGRATVTNLPPPSAPSLREGEYISSPLPDAGERAG
jgi:predicted aconitase with swiveling domain